MNRRPATAVIRTLVPALLALALSACGNKGPLVMPDKPDPAGTTTQPAPAAQPAATPAGQAQAGRAAR